MVHPSGELARFRLSFKRKERRDHRDSISSAVPAKFIRATSVRPQTLNPRWNEKFRLMAYQSLFKIGDWRKENSEIKIRNYLFACGGTTSRRQRINLGRYEPLRYFNNDAYLNRDVIVEKINNVIGMLEMIKYDPYRLACDFRGIINNYPDNCFITSRSVLSKIMNTPFEINQEKRKWVINVKITIKGIKLYYDEDTVISTRSQSFLKHEELLKNYLFTENPQIEYLPDTISLINENFFEINRLDVGNHKLAFTVETPGVISNEVINDFHTLLLSDHVYYELIDATDFTPVMMNYNPIWWSKAKLANAKQCVIGVYNKRNNNIQEIIKFNADKLNDMRAYENTWSPKAAWNFLNQFLSYIKNELAKIPEADRRNTILKLQSFYKDKPFIVCERIKS
ncbi:hypothetical protein O3M35_011618 [Rhynocoris fuscipes]|uniref:RAI1-like domain-containing protein n=1 Tax=Rhynocoris fuscipes TaxID=488301 RepID=A0AAW1D1G5_9HEMI